MVLLNYEQCYGLDEVTKHGLAGSIHASCEL